VFQQRKTLLRPIEHGGIRGLKDVFAVAVVGYVAKNLRRMDPQVVADN